eukprot:TRINITY_DN6335_c0_g1_i2.p2 TRINITY_DN6335_c0_g1~~TRINITY_DN6335_c0_g1_i2.p2  ORF type:complete len:141 (+),score=26.80 TRINITY_DN6335_c0_g1_i2:96-518(+)
MCLLNVNRSNEPCNHDHCKEFENLRKRKRISEDVVEFPPGIDNTISKDLQSKGERMVSKSYMPGLLEFLGKDCFRQSEKEAQESTSNEGEWNIHEKLKELLNSATIVLMNQESAISTLLDRYKTLTETASVIHGEVSRLK